MWTKLTEMETEIVMSIVWACHSSDGHGFGGWLDHEQFDMTKYRGAMASLTKKKVAYFETYEDEPNRTWGSIAEKHMKKVKGNYLTKICDEEVKRIIDWSDYMLVGLKLCNNNK